MRVIHIGLVVVAGLLGILIGLVLQNDSGNTGATTQTAEISDAEFTARVREALLDQPEILQEVFFVLETRTRQNELSGLQSAIDRNYALIEQAPAVFVGGNPDGDVTIVEFFDYECGYCRRALPELEEFLAADGNIRIVYYEMPILGERSQMATLAALAADNQGLYNEFHVAAMGSGERLTEEVIFTIATEIGMDTDQFQADLMDPSLTERVNANLEFAQALQINSTPTFLVGGKVALGWNEENVQALLDEARAR